MAKIRGNPDKLIPTNRRTKQEASELGRKGGIASGEARREARRWKDYYNSIIADKYIIKDKEGKEIDVPFDELAKNAIKRIVQASDSTTVSLFREMRQAMDGDSVEVLATVETLDLTAGMTYEQKQARIAELLEKRNQCQS